MKRLPRGLQSSNEDSVARRGGAGGEYDGLSGGYLLGGEDTISGVAFIAYGALRGGTDGGTGNREYESTDERNATEAGGVSTSDGILPSTGVGGTNICTQKYTSSEFKEK